MMISNILSLKFFQKFVYPARMPVFVLSAILLGLGLYSGLITSPPDYQQGEMVRIMYVHVPSAWLALGIYLFIALLSFVSLVWDIKLSFFYCLAAAPVGAGVALTTLVTGSIWGAPIWGSWWVWDGRLTSMLILFFTYVMYIATASSGDELMRARRPASVLAIIGAINLPIVKFSVQIWYSLHQGPSIMRSGGSAIAPEMMKPLFLMFAGLALLCTGLIIQRTQIVIENAKNHRL